jgi:hypothetical protein
VCGRRPWRGCAFSPSSLSLSHSLLPAWKSLCWVRALAFQCARSVAAGPRQRRARSWVSYLLRERRNGPPPLLASCARQSSLDTKMVNTGVRAREHNFTLGKSASLSLWRQRLRNAVLVPCSFLFVIFTARTLSRLSRACGRCILLLCFQKALQWWQECSSPREMKQESASSCAWMNNVRASFPGKTLLHGERKIKRLHSNTHRERIKNIFLIF